MEFIKIIKNSIFQYLFLSDSLIYLLINLSKSGETSLVGSPNRVLSGGTL